jgi:hypothetical protein
MEDEIFRIANNALYFADSSDYSNALWEILEYLRPDLFEDDSEPELHYICD